MAETAGCAPSIADDLDLDADQGVVNRASSDVQWREHFRERGNFGRGDRNEIRERAADNRAASVGVTRASPSGRVSTE
jgi:hypothetical protein